MICFCVSRGKSRRYNLPRDLSICTDLPFECLLSPDAFGLEALIAGGENGMRNEYEGGLEVHGGFCRGTQARRMCLLVSNHSTAK